MKPNKFTGRFVTCPKYRKTFELTKGQLTCPYCGELLTEAKHAEDYIREKKRAARRMA